MLAELDLEAEREALMDELATTKSLLKPKKIIKRLKVVESFIDSGNRPEWMILEVIPVIPARTAPAGAARWRPLCDVGSQRSSTAA